jgi:hypothetical protein
MQTPAGAALRQIQGARSHHQTEQTANGRARTRQPGAGPQLPPGQAAALLSLEGTPATPAAESLHSGLARLSPPKRAAVPPAKPRQQPSFSGQLAAAEGLSVVVGGGALLLSSNYPHKSRALHRRHFSDEFQGPGGLAKAGESEAAVGDSLTAEESGRSVQKEHDRNG